MEGSETQTHAFMNVESVSPTSLSPPNESLMIRLFGKEVGGSDPTTNDLNSAAIIIHDETLRKFDCQYCRRKFPTSQALGGHQNAHRRERLKARQPITSSSNSNSKPQLHNFLNGYPSNNITTTYNNCSRCFGNGTSHPTPINSRPLLPSWRFPTTMQNLTTFKLGGLLNSSAIYDSTSLSLYMHESDQVSLDLHL